MIFVRSCPARPTKASPCASSSAPGPSPTKTSGILPDARVEDDLRALLVQRALHARLRLGAAAPRAAPPSRRRAPSAGGGGPKLRLRFRRARGAVTGGRERERAARRRSGPQAASRRRRSRRDCRRGGRVAGATRGTAAPRVPVRIGPERDPARQLVLEVRDESPARCGSRSMHVRLLRMPTLLAKTPRASRSGEDLVAPPRAWSSGRAARSGRPCRGRETWSSRRRRRSPGGSRR